MSEVSHKPIIDYFRNLNQQHTSFPDKSFFRQNLEEIFGAFRQGINFPALAVESPDGDMEGSSANNSVVGRMFAFTIYKLPALGNFDQEEQFLDDCEKLGLDIIKRMRRDNAINDNILYGRFDHTTVKFHKITGVYNEGLCGYRFTGFIKGTESLKVDHGVWDDLDSNC